MLSTLPWIHLDVLPSSCLAPIEVKLSCLATFEVKLPSLRLEPVGIILPPSCLERIKPKLPALCLECHGGFHWALQSVVLPEIQWFTFLSSCLALVHLAGIMPMPAPFLAPVAFTMSSQHFSERSLEINSKNCTHRVGTWEMTIGLVVWNKTCLNPLVLCWGGDWTGP